MKIGRYIAMTTPPTRTPAKRSTAGSIKLVSLLKLLGKLLVLLGGNGGQHLVEASAGFARLDHLESHRPEQPALPQGFGERIALLYRPVRKPKDMREVAVPGG